MSNIGALFNLENMMNNTVFYGVLSLFLTIYGPRLSPNLPIFIRNLFNNNFFRFIIILLITFLSSSNLQIALIISIVFLLITSYTNSIEVVDSFKENFIENYSEFDTIREFKENFPENVVKSMNMNTQRLNSNIQEHLNCGESSKTEDVEGHHVEGNVEEERVVEDQEEFKNYNSIVKNTHNLNSITKLINNQLKKYVNPL